MDGLGQMVGQDGGRPVQIGDGAGHPQNAVIAAGGESHVLVGPFHKGLSLWVQGAPAAQGLLAHGGVAGGAIGAEAGALPGAGLGDPGADGGGGFPGAAVGKGFKLQGRHLGEKINPVQQRAGELAQVTLHLGRCAPAPAGGMAIPAAFAGVHGTQKGEVTGVGLRRGGADHGDDPLLHGLAEDLNHIFMKLWQLIQKENPRLTVVFNTVSQMCVEGV